MEVHCITEESLFKQNPPWKGLHRSNDASTQSPSRSNCIHCIWRVFCCANSNGASVVILKLFGFHVTSLVLFLITRWHLFLSSTSSSVICLERGRIKEHWKYVLSWIVTLLGFLFGTGLKQNLLIKEFHGTWTGLHNHWIHLFRHKNINVQILIPLKPGGGDKKLKGGGNERLWQTLILVRKLTKCSSLNVPR
jgi:hypothetical protein